MRRKRPAKAAEPPPPPAEPADKTPAEPTSTDHAAELEKPPEPRAFTRAEREEAWQDFLARARVEHPGPEPVRETMTWTEATDWVDRQVEQRVREAQGAYWNPFDPQAAEDYVAFHAAQAHEHAWNMLMHDLGVDVPSEDARSLASSAAEQDKPLPGQSGHAEPPAIVVSSPEGVHTLVRESGASPVHDSFSLHGPPHSSVHDEAHPGDPETPKSPERPETPAIVVTSPEGEPTLVQAVGGHTPPEVVRFAAPRDTVAHTQAVAAVPRAVGWKTLLAHSENGEVFDGARGIGGPALHDRLGLAEGGFDGVVMVVCGAAADPESGAAAKLHASSGDSVPVLAPTGDAMIGPDGDVISGTWTVDEDLRAVPDAVGDWVVWQDGVATSLGTPSLGEALRRLGVAVVTGGPPPEAPVGFFHGLNEQQRATLGHLRYDVSEDDLRTPPPQTPSTVP